MRKEKKDTPPPSPRDRGQDDVYEERQNLSQVLQQSRNSTQAAAASPVPLNQQRRESLKLPGGQYLHEPCSYPELCNEESKASDDADMESPSSSRRSTGFILCLATIVAIVLPATWRGQYDTPVATTLFEGNSSKVERMRHLELVLSATGPARRLNLSWAAACKDVLVYHSSAGSEHANSKLCETCTTVHVYAGRSFAAAWASPANRTARLPQHEALHYLTHIVQRYDQLSEMTAFLPSQAQEISPDLLQLLGYLERWSPVQPLGWQRPEGAYLLRRRSGSYVGSPGAGARVAVVRNDRNFNLVGDHGASFVAAQDPEPWVMQMYIPHADDFDYEDATGPIASPEGSAVAAGLGGDGESPSIPVGARGLLNDELGARSDSASFPLCAVWEALHLGTSCPETIFVNYRNSFAVSRETILRRPR